MHTIQEFDKRYYEEVIEFLDRCLPESGRTLDLKGSYKIYCDIEGYFEYFWCMFEAGRIIGTVAVRELEVKKCELKSLYLLERYQGKGLGYELLQTAIKKARDAGYDKMYLDTISTSKRAIDLYQRIGFITTERYNENPIADVFMVLELNGLCR